MTFLHLGALTNFRHLPHSAQHPHSPTRRVLEFTALHFNAEYVSLNLFLWRNSDKGKSRWKSTVNPHVPFTKAQHRQLGVSLVLFKLLPVSPLPYYFEASILDFIN